MKVHGPEDPVLLPQGFRFAAARAGIKASGKPDLALAETPGGASAAAMFTRNRVAAAPVVVGREHLRRSRGRLRAVLVNSGNANCATGAAGLRAARSSCAAVGSALGAAAEFILPSSTGIIGVPLPVEKILSAAPALAAGRASGERALRAFGRAIMTTDTRPKLASAAFAAGGKTVAVAGVAKGSGMIHPDLATMLVYIFSDIEAMPAAMRRHLRAAVEDTVNAISVDGDTSTNDTVLALASGASGVRLAAPGVERRFAEALRGVCGALAEQIVRDGEGAGHLVRLRVEQARSRAEARRVADAVATSLLVKTAWAGCDPNWGRILAAVGRAGIALDPSGVGIDIGPHVVCRRGVAHPCDERAAHEILKRREYDLCVRLGRGRAAARLLTCDLTAEYVRINADYST